MATQIDLLANVQIIDQSIRAKTLAVEEAQGRVAALEEAVQTQSAAATVAVQIVIVPAANIPTLSEQALIMMMLLLAIAGVIYLRRIRR